MKIPKRLMLLFKLHALLISCTLAAPTTNQSTFFQRAGHNRRLRTLYPLSVADLIVDYFQNYKHIKQLTLFLCDERSSSAIVAQSYDDNDADNSNEKAFAHDDDDGDGDRQQTHASQRHSNFQQIVKRLMATANFLIKGDANIDAKNFRAGDPFYIPDMLKCGDFKLGVVLDLRCRQSKFIFQQASEYGLFNTSHHWLVLLEPSTSAQTSSSTALPTSLAEVDFFKSLNINMNSEITLAKPHQAASTSGTTEWDRYDLYDMWNSGNLYGGKLNLTHMGFYSTNDKLLQIAFKETTIVRRLNVDGIRIRTMLVVTNKFSESFDKYLDHTFNPHLDSMNRFNYRLLTYVRDLFNFRWMVYRTNSWGYLKNGTFDGMIGALVRKEIDVGGSPIFFRSERAKVIDYTARTWISRPCFVFRHPTVLERNVFLTPFSKYVWYCIVASGCLIICIAVVISYREMKNYYRRPGIEQTLDANHGGVKHQQCSPTHTSRVQHTDTMTTKRNRKFENNNDTFVMSTGTTIQREQRTPPTTRVLDNSSDRHRQQRNSANAPSSLRDRRQKQQRRQHHLHYQQKIISKNIIIETWRKLFGGGNFASIAQNRNQKYPTEEINYNLSEKIIGKIFHRNPAAIDDDYYGRCQCQGDSTERCIDCAAALERRQQSVSDRNDESSISRCCLLFLGALCQQGTSETPHQISRRCIVLLILLFGFLIFQFYSASIVGSLLMEKPKTIKTLRNLIDSTLDLGIEDIVYNRDFFKRTTDADALELFNEKVRIVNAKTGDVTYNFFQPAEGMEKVKKGGFAFHADSATFYKIILDEFPEREICELSEIQLFPEQHMMAIVQKGSPLRKMITYGLRRVVESGLLNHERKRWHSPKPMCVRQIQPEDLQVHLQSLISALLLLMTGMCSSIVILLLEYMVWLITKKMNANRIEYLN